MPSIFAKSSIALGALVVLLFGAPAFAQSQSSGGGDLFSGVPAVDSDQMSAVSGELPEGTGVGTPSRVRPDDCGAGARCGSGVQGNAVGTTTRDVATSTNTVSINVTAINNQTSIAGPGVINTSGGFNAAGGGN